MGARTVNNIFYWLSRTVTRLSTVPSHVPGKAMARKEGIEKILKHLQGENKCFRYQVRLGTNDLEIYLKNHVEYNYRPYRKVELHLVDPKGEVPNWDFTVKDDKPEEEVANAEREKQAGKRAASHSPEGRSAKRRNINDWQILEAILAYLERTQTKPKYKDLEWELEADESGTHGEDEEEKYPGE